MANNWNKPVTSDSYTSILTTIRDMFASAIKMDFTGDSNLPSGAIKSNSSNADKLEKWNGSSYSALSFHGTIDSHIADTSIHFALPSGLIFPYGGGTAPSGFLLCDGTAISRTTYAALFSAIGTTFGPGNGSTTFNLPDMRGRFPLGKSVSGTGSTLGGNGGALDHTHTGPSHIHTIAAHNHDMGNHTHTSAAHSHTVASHTHSVPAHYHDTQGSGATINITSSGEHQHDISRGPGGGSSGSARVGLSDGSASTSTSTTNNTTPRHVHAHTDFTGLVGNVTSANNGDSGFTTGGTSLTTDSTTPGATGTPSSNSTSSTSLTTDASGTGITGSANPAYLSLNYIIKI